MFGFFLHINIVRYWKVRLVFFYFFYRYSVLVYSRCRRRCRAFPFTSGNLILKFLSELARRVLKLIDTKANDRARKYLPRSTPTHTHIHVIILYLRWMRTFVDLCVLVKCRPGRHLLVGGGTCYKTDRGVGARVVFRCVCDSFQRIFTCSETLKTLL